MHTDPETIAPRVTTLRIIVIAMTVGCIAVLAIMYALYKPAQEVERTLTVLSLAFSGAMVLARLVLPRAMAAAARQQLAGADEAVWTPRLLDVYQTRTIIGAALLEGPVFFLAFAYMSEGHPATILVGVLLTLAIAAQFPTATRVAAWVDAQREQIQRSGSV